MEEVFQFQIYMFQKNLGGAGLFGYAIAANITNLTLESGYVEGDSMCGALVAVPSSSYISNITSKVEVKGNEYVRGDCRT